MKLKFPKPHLPRIRKPKVKAKGGAHGSAKVEL